MLESISSNNTFEYEKLSQEEQQKRGILGRLVGVMADSKNPTRNGRKYSAELWEKVFNNPIMKEKIENRVCFGEACHPTDGREEVDPEKVAICLAEVPKINNKGQLIGIFDVLDTPCGRILKTMLDYGANIGVSSRGSGDLFTDYDGQESVDPDTYDCICWDAVFVPAVKEARLKLVTESLQGKTLKQALLESIESANEDDRKLMKETLNDLNINLIEDDKKLMEDTLSNLNIEVQDKSILDKVIDNFGTSDTYYFGPSFILPNGLLLDLSNESSHSSVEKWLIDNNLSNEDFNISTGSPTLYNLGCIRVDSVKYYIALSPIQPTREQYNSLLVWLDNLSKSTSFVEVITPDNQHITYNFKEIITDYVVDRIRRYYSSGVLYEKLNQKHQHEFLYKRNPLGEGIDAADNINESSTDDLPVDNDKGDLEEFQAIVKENNELAETITKLQEKLSVSYAKEAELQEELNRAKQSINKLSTDSKRATPLKAKVKVLSENIDTLNESIKAKDNINKKLRFKINESLNQISELENQISSKDNEISILEEKVEKSVKIANIKISKLNESIDRLQKDLDKQADDYNKKLANANKLVENYKSITQKAVDKYIDSQALMIGVSSNEIKNKLSNNYSFNDIDIICENLKDYKVNVSKLPFRTTSPLMENAQIKTTSYKKDSILPAVDDSDEVDNQLKNLAGLI